MDYFTSRIKEQNFLIMPNGQLITLSIPISKKKKLKLMLDYQNIVNPYATNHTSTWQILDFPYTVKLPSNSYQLVFAQKLKDGCNACVLVSKAHVAYDFWRRRKKVMQCKST